MRARVSDIWRDPDDPYSFYACSCTQVFACKTFVNISIPTHTHTQQAREAVDKTRAFDNGMCSILFADPDARLELLKNVLDHKSQKHAAVMHGTRRLHMRCVFTYVCTSLLVCTRASL